MVAAAITDNLIRVTNRNVAVFIDAENLFKGYGKLDIPDVGMEEILDQLEAAAKREAGSGSIAMSRAYADWNALGIEDYRRDVERAGVRTMQVFSVGKADKNAADIELVVDCLRAAADLEQLEVFVIVSADGDFVPLVRRLHELGKYVIGATLAQHAVNSVLEQEVDQYVALKAVPVPPAAALTPLFSGDGSMAAAEPARGRRRPAADRAADTDEDAPRSGRRGQQAKEPKDPAGGSGRRRGGGKQAEPVKKASGRPEWHRLAQQIPVVHEAAAASPDDYKAVVARVLEEPTARSFFDQLADHGGTLPIAAMAIKAAAPAMSPSDARVSSLSRALRFALAGTPYALARESDDVQPVLVRRAANPAGMLTDLSLDDIQRGVQ